MALSSLCPIIDPLKFFDIHLSTASITDHPKPLPLKPWVQHQAHRPFRELIINRLIVDYMPSRCDLQLGLSAR